MPSAHRWLRPSLAGGPWPVISGIHRTATLAEPPDRPTVPVWASLSRPRFESAIRAWGARGDATGATSEPETPGRGDGHVPCLRKQHHGHDSSGGRRATAAAGDPRVTRAGRL